MVESLFDGVKNSVLKDQGIESSENSTVIVQKVVRRSWKQLLIFGLTIDTALKLEQDR